MPDSLDREIRTLQSIFWSERDPEGLAFASLADAFRRRGDVREALDLLTEGMSRHPGYATGHVVATRLYLDQGMSSEAEISARRVLELDAENLVALSTLTSVLAERGDTAEAARHRTLLMSLDPESEEAREVADLDLEADAQRVVESEPLLDDLTLEPLPEEGTESDEEELSAAMDALGLVGDAPGEEPLTASEAEVAELESELPGPEVELPDLDAIIADEPIEVAGEAMDFGADLPKLDQAEEPTDEDEAVELADLAPDEPEEDAVDLAALAPDEPEEQAVELADLAPDEPEEDAVDLAALAPDEPEEQAVELADLAPDEPEERAVELADLAPDEPEEDAVDLAALAPDEPEGQAVELADLAPEEDAVDLAGEDENGVSEPIYTRTLAELYIKQGFTDKALEVLKALYEMNPHATDLADRIEALEKGEREPDELSSSSLPAARPPASLGDGHTEDEVEARARELAGRGLEGSDELDTPFAWSASNDAQEESAPDEDAEPAAGSYFDRLLGWEDRGES